MVENWLERTKGMLVQMHCKLKRNWNVRPHCCRMRLLSGVSVTRTAPLERVTWRFFLDEFKKHYVGCYRPNDIYKFMMLSPKDYYLIPSNNAMKLVYCVPLIKSSFP